MADHVGMTFPVDNVRLVLSWIFIIHNNDVPLTIKSQITTYNNSIMCITFISWYNMINMYTVNDVFSTALRPFSGTSRGSFASPNGIVADAVRTASRTVDFIESKRVIPLEPALYGGDNLYYCPEDADTIIDIAPMSGRSATETADFTKTNPLTISNDFRNRNTVFTTEWRNGVKMLRVQPGFIHDTPLILNMCDSLTDNGTVSVAGDAHNLDVNKVFYLHGSAAIDFNIIPSTGTATINIVDFDAKDISTITRDGVFTLGIFIPQELVGKITNLQLLIGNNSYNYYQMESVHNVYGGEFIHGFNIVRFQKRNASPVGSIDETDIRFARFNIVHTLSSPVIGVKIDALSAHKGVGYNVSYYSDYHFISSATGAFIRTPSSTGLADTVIANSDSFELIVQEAIKIMDMNLRGEKGGSQYKLADRELNGIWGDFSRPGLYEQYRLRYPSERRSVVTAYTDSPYE